MKAKLIRGDLAVAPKSAAYSADFVESNSREDPANPKGRVWNWGTVLEGPLVWQLCCQGVALPDDDECREVAGLTDQQLGELQAAYELLKQDGSYQSLASQPGIIDESDDV